MMIFLEMYPFDLYSCLSFCFVMFLDILFFIHFIMHQIFLQIFCALEIILSMLWLYRVSYIWYSLYRIPCNTRLGILYTESSLVPLALFYVFVCIPNVSHSVSSKLGLVAPFGSIFSIPSPCVCLLTQFIFAYYVYRVLGLGIPCVCIFYTDSHYPYPLYRVCLVGIQSQDILKVFKKKI